MLISFLVIKWLRYNPVKWRGRQIIKAHRRRHCTYPIDRLQAYIHGQIDPEKGQTFKQRVSFLPGKFFQCPKIILRAERCNYLDKQRVTAPAPFCLRLVPSPVRIKFRPRYYGLRTDWGIKRRCSPQSLFYTDWTQSIKILLTSNWLKSPNKG